MIFRTEISCKTEETDNLSIQDATPIFDRDLLLDFVGLMSDNLSRILELDSTVTDEDQPCELQFLTMPLPAFYRK